MQFYRELTAHVCGRINNYTKIVKPDTKRKTRLKIQGKEYFVSFRPILKKRKGRKKNHLRYTTPICIAPVNMTKRGKLIDFNKLWGWLSSLSDLQLRNSLPLYGKALEKAYNIGYLPDFPRLEGDDTLFSLFSHLTTGGGIIRYNGDELRIIGSRMIDRVNEFQALIIKAIRQITLYWYKLEYPFTEEDKNIAYRKFIAIDQSVITEDQITENLTISEICALKHMISYFLPKLPRKTGEKFIYKFSAGTLVPIKYNTYEKGLWGHSAGAAADLKSPTRFNARRWSRPASDGLWEIILAGRYSELYAAACPTTEVEEKHAKLVLVPKDSRGPRVICEEPASMAYAQQYIKHKLYEHLELRGLSLEFQDPNRFAAYIGSVTGEYSTLDLKDASDRVSVSHITKLFPSEWQKVLLLLRTPTVNINGVIFEQRKYAPMGSALCFPVETIIYGAVAYIATRFKLGVKEAKKIFKNGYGCRAYGDDIIVPQAAAEYCSDLLHRLGFVVNLDKSFIRGLYRESCGKHYINGYDVTVSQKHQVERTPDFIVHAEALWPGFRANCTHGMAEGVPSGPLSLMVNDRNVRWNAKLHRIEIYTTVKRGENTQIEQQLYRSQAKLEELNFVTYHDMVDELAYTDWLIAYSGRTEEKNFFASDYVNHKTLIEYIDNCGDTRQRRSIQRFTQQEKTVKRWVPFGCCYTHEVDDLIELSRALKETYESRLLEQSMKQKARSGKKSKKQNSSSGTNSATPTSSEQSPTHSASIGKDHQSSGTTDRSLKPGGSV